METGVSSGPADLLLLVQLSRLAGYAGSACLRAKWDGSVGLLLGEHAVGELKPGLDTTRA